MKKTEVLKLIVVTKTLWPNWKAPETTEETNLAVETWQAILDDVPAELAAAAVRSLATSGREFAPPVGVIRHEALQLVSRADGSAAPGVDEAWGEVQRAARTRGYAAGAPDWSHPAVGNAVESLGWRDICHSTNPEALRAHFFKVYGAAVDRGNRDRHIPNAVADLAQRVSIGHRMPELNS